MPELRRDPVVGYWTIIASERSRRPMEYRPKENTAESAECPFCEGRESQTTDEVFAIRQPGTAANAPGWSVRTILSKVPMLSPITPEVDRYACGMYDVMDGVGQHEIVIESPHHKHDLDDLSLSQVENVIRAYVHRFRELGKDGRFEYTVLFKNHGHVSGAPKDIVHHSRSQLISMPITPKRAKEELSMAKSFFERRERCVFCDVIRQESLEKTRVVDENESFICFCPFASRSPFEMWIFPKRHCADFGRMDEGDVPQFAKILKKSLLKLHNLLDDPPFNFILHAAPHRNPNHHQTLWAGVDDYHHWYLQISPRLTRSAGFEWGTGIHINPTPPEDAADLLRSADSDRMDWESL